MGVRCVCCGKDFVIGENFYELVPVTLTDNGIFDSMRMDEGDYACEDCIDSNAMENRSEDAEPHVNLAERD